MEITGLASTMIIEMDILSKWDISVKLATGKVMLTEATESNYSCLGTTTFAEHKIRLKDGEPIAQRYRPVNPRLQAVMDEEVERMLADNVIEQSCSPWSSPVVLVKIRRLNSDSV